MTKLVCSVDTCIHNSDHYCCKGKIKVDGENADMPSSTCCASFDEKKTAAAATPTNHPMNRWR